MIEMSANGGLLEEYEQIKMINERISKGDSPYGQRQPIKLFVIKPEFPLPLDPDLFFNKINTSTLINLGYADAKKNVTNKPTKEIPFDKESTKMSTPGLTFSFRQHFSGKLKTADGSQPVQLHLAFTLRELDGKKSMQHSSSVFIHLFGEEIPTYQNQSSISHVKDASVIKVSSQFYHEGSTYHLHASLPLSSLSDWYLALEFKRIDVKISKLEKTGELPWMTGVLSQGARSRVKNYISSNLRFASNGLKFLEKHKMISILYQNEV
jgi:hypothetical protein